MVNQKVSSRYAVSLLESSLEKKSLDSMSGEVESVIKSIKGSPELTRVLHNPVIKTETKLSIVTEIFKGRINEDLLNFLQFVINKGREEHLLNILETYIKLRDEHLGIVNVLVRTAFEFTPEQSEKLKANFEDNLKKKVNLKFVIDKNIIGGFVAKVDDTIYDASVKHQLELLKKEFLSGGVPLN